MKKNKSFMLLVCGMVFLAAGICGCQKEEIKREKVPVWTGETITRVGVKEQNSWKYDFQYQPDEYKSEFAFWSCVEPYHDLVTMNTEMLYEELFAALESIDFASLPSEEGSISLDKADAVIYVDYADEKGKETEGTVYTAALLVGEQKENIYPVYLDQENICYQVPVSVIDKILNVDPYDYLLRIGCLVNLDTVEQVKIEQEGDIFCMEIKRDKNEVRYFFDKEQVEKKQFTALYQEIMGIAVAKEAEEGRAEGEPLFQVTYLRTEGDAETMKVAYYPYDEQYARLEVNGESYFLVELKEVEQICDKVENELFRK